MDASRTDTSCQRSVPNNTRTCNGIRDNADRRTWHMERHATPQKEAHSVGREQQQQQKTTAVRLHTKRLEIVRPLRNKLHHQHQHRRNDLQAKLKKIKTKFNNIKLCSAFPDKVDSGRYPRHILSKSFSMEKSMWSARTPFYLSINGYLLGIGFSIGAERCTRINSPICCIAEQNRFNIGHYGRRCCT